MGNNSNLDLEILEISSVVDKITTGFVALREKISNQSKVINNRRKLIWEQFKNIF